MRPVEEILDEAEKSDDPLVHELGHRLDMALGIMQRVAKENAKVLLDIYGFQCSKKEAEELAKEASEPDKTNMMH